MKAAEPIRDRKIRVDAIIKYLLFVKVFEGVLKKHKCTITII